MTHDPLKIEVEPNDVVMIEGIRYAGVVFRELATFLPIGQWFRLVKREDGVLTIERCPAIHLPLIEQIERLAWLKFSRIEGDKIVFSDEIWKDEDSESFELVQKARALVAPAITAPLPPPITTKDDHNMKKLA